MFVLCFPFTVSSFILLTVIRFLFFFSITFASTLPEADRTEIGESERGKRGTGPFQPGHLRTDIPMNSVPETIVCHLEPGKHEVPGNDSYYQCTTVM